MNEQNKHFADFSPSVPREVSIASGEKVIVVLDRSYISFVSLATVGFVILWVVISIINFYIPPELQWIMFPLLVLCFLILPSLVYGLGYFYVKGHRYIITNERIIMFRRFIGILLRTVTHDKITDLIVSQGPIGRLCNYGRISPVTAGMIMPVGGFIFSISGVRNPYEVRNRIAELVKTMQPEEPKD